MSDEKGHELQNESKEFVDVRFSAIRRPDTVYNVDDLPKMMYEKVIRALLMAILTGTPMSDRSSLRNPETVRTIGELLTT
jgi:acyl-coenzyme A synthetase/AMP-(fatty) acid ligase